MKIYEGIDFTGQTVEPTEQTQFIRCVISAEQIIDQGTIGWELLACTPPEVANGDN